MRKQKTLLYVNGISSEKNFLKKANIFYIK